MRSRPTMMKRARERARAERQKEKAARRLERSQQAPDRSLQPDGVDPDIAHIRPGPQPPAEWQIDAETTDDNGENGNESASS